VSSLDKFEFAVLVVTPDDVRERRGEVAEIPRDNVVFEIGLFIGRFGRERTFIVCDPASVTLPTDLIGIAVAEYDSARSDGNMLAALGPACTKIARAIKTAPRVAGSSSVSRRTEFLLGDVDALYGMIARWPIPNSGVIIRHFNTRWAWKLFPTILRWRLTDTPVTAFLSPISGDERERRQEMYRRQLLADLGAVLIEGPDADVTGFFLDTDNYDDSCAVVLNSNPAEYEPIAVAYAGKEHLPAIRALQRRLPPMSHAQLEGYVPTVGPSDATPVLKILKEGVRQYSAIGVRIREDTLPTERLHLITPYTRAYKYVQIQGLDHVYSTNGLLPFTTGLVVRRTQEPSIMTPPVIEIHDGLFIVIEGNTRATFAMQQRRSEFYCLVVTGVTQDLPGEPVGIDKVSVVERYLAPTDRIASFDYGRFRHIERAVHPY
jgi:hypothetical protein